MKKYYQQNPDREIDRFIEENEKISWTKIIVIFLIFVGMMTISLLIANCGGSSAG